MKKAKWLGRNRFSKTTLEERFWEKVDKLGTNECWEWMGGKTKGGYGSFRCEMGFKAHRASWVIHFGKIGNGLDVLHTCDNPGCVNPNHLYLGTDLENARDRVSRGRDRHLFGSNNPNAKLNESDVARIRHLYSIGERSYRQLSKEYNISQGAIGKILTGESWKHVPMEKKYDKNST